VEFNWGHAFNLFLFALVFRRESRVEANVTTVGALCSIQLYCIFQMGIDPGRYTSEQGVSNKRSTTSRTTESFIANGYCGQFTSFDHESALSSNNIAHIDRILVRIQAFVFYVD